MAVARKLGRSGEMVIMQLGVPDHIVADIEGRHGNNKTVFFLHCLRVWCQMKMVDANPDNLKRALSENDRNDLVELVDEHLSGKTAGYTTS